MYGIFLMRCLPVVLSLTKIKIFWEADAVWLNITDLQTFPISPHWFAPKRSYFLLCFKWLEKCTTAKWAWCSTGLLIHCSSDIFCSGNLLFCCTFVCRPVYIIHIHRQVAALLGRCGLWVNVSVWVSLCSRCSLLPMNLAFSEMFNYYPSWSSYCLRKQSPAGKKSQHLSWYIFQT